MAQQAWKRLALAGLMGVLGVTVGCNDRREGTVRDEARQVGQETRELGQETRELGQETRETTEEAVQGFEEGYGGAGEERDGEGLRENERR